MGTSPFHASRPAFLCVEVEHKDGGVEIRTHVGRWDLGQQVHVPVDSTRNTVVVADANRVTKGDVVGAITSDQILQLNKFSGKNTYRTHK